MNRSSWLKAGYTKYLVLLLIPVLFFIIPGLPEFSQKGLDLLQHRHIEGVRQLILSYGWLAPFMTILLMIIQSLVPFVPGMILTVVNAWIFGWLAGAAYTWVGALLGALADFALSRYLGRPFVEKVISIKQLQNYSTFFQQYGLWAVFASRMIPVIPFKVVSYGAGLTKISWQNYILATALGQTPPILLYSILGQNIFHNFHYVIVVTSISFLLILLLYFFRHYFKGILDFFR